ncbi:MAG: ribosome maturation factor RimP [Thermodesulfobacteriota bacterium]|nr:ribosome maturation factor RimP [Thermodesulfobacteriota bacterium]
MKEDKRNIKVKKSEPVTGLFSPATREDVIDKIIQFAGPLCESEGMELVHVECQRETGGRIIRIYIDKPGGVTLNDCTLISRQLSDMLDVNLDTNWAYSLEVSSPGIDRPLGKPEDFDSFKGKTEIIRTSVPIEGQKNFKGLLLGFYDGSVKLDVNDKIVTIPFRDITKARLFNYNGENEC